MNEHPLPSPNFKFYALRRFLAIFVLGSTLLSATAVLHFQFNSRAAQMKRETGEMFNLNLGKTAINRELENVVSDLKFLAQYNEAPLVFNEGDTDGRNAMARQFQVFSAQKAKYDQIRLIDSAGREVVRVNYSDGHPTITTPDQLQNKADRYYFSRIWAMQRGGIYISPMDLNVEQGIIEKPIKPVIRIGTPIFDHSGRKIGVIVLNYLGALLISDFKTTAAAIADHLMLVNARGFWISSPDPRDAWGFMFGNDKTFAKAYPQAWRQISGRNDGQFTTKKGLFTFTTVAPGSACLRHPKLPEGTRGSEYSNGYCWKAISHVTPVALAATLTTFAGNQAMVYGAMLILLGAAAAFIARISLSHERAVTQVEAERLFRDLIERRLEAQRRELENTEDQRRMMVQRLAQAEKMAAMGVMAAGIGHEINNPLYTILGLAEALEDEDDRAQRKSFSRDIIQNTKEIATTVRNLSGYVRANSDDGLQRIDVNEALEDSIAMARRTRLDDQATIRLHRGSVPPVTANAGELRQVFFNVIRNALQAMPDGGDLTISTCVGAEKTVVARITDTGVGISEENLDRVFNPFFTTKGPDEGEGIGLFVAHQIVEKHKGTIRYFNNTGPGACCEIELPAALADEEPSHE